MNDKLNEALEQISDAHIHEAAQTKRRRPIFFGAVAAVLAVVIGFTAIWHSFDKADNPTSPLILATDPTTSTQFPTTSTKPPIPGPPVLVPLSGLAAAPVYPQDWQNYQRPDGYAENLHDFFHLSIQQFLSGEGNRAYSPLNVYMALAMLAETTGGDSRQQILNLLGADSIEELRTQAGHVWNRHFCNDEHTRLLLANSLWLDNGPLYNMDTVQTLADSYYASVFSGDLGSEEMNESLRQWINNQTGGLLKDQTQELTLHPNTVFALASTVYFKANWITSFSENQTANGLFHASTGDVTVPFMNSSSTASAYYWGEDYSAVRLSLEQGNAMWLILPEEGKSTADVLKSGEFLSTVLPTEMITNVAYPTIHLSMPKFDISTKNDLVSGLKNLGVTDIFSTDTADMTPLTVNGICVRNIEHAVRVATNEDGVFGAAYTVIQAPTDSVPPLVSEEVDFVLDRPFLFAVTSRDGLPLFAGVVEQP